MYSLYVGVGICAPDIMCNRETTTAECPIKCATFIYPLLDWETNPLMAVSISFGGILLVVIAHLFLWTVSKSRIYQKELKVPKDS